MKKIFPLFCLVIIFIVIADVDVSAQCAMCRASVENNIKEGRNIGAGLNSGILYLMAIPYIIFSTIAFFWYRSSRQKKQSFN
jgi:hypothetical protein